MKVIKLIPKRRDLDKIELLIAMVDYPTIENKSHNDLVRYLGIFVALAEQTETQELKEIVASFITYLKGELKYE